jgi:tetratricopeptide (TPR) repeat protein
MVADTYFELGKRDRSPAETDRAMRIYQLLTEKYPDSVATPRTILLMGYSYLAKGDSFAALRNFEKFMRTQPNSKHIDQVRISAAEAYLRLARYDDAYAMLSEVEKNAKSEKMRAEAAYRKGDVFFRKRDWERAITEYKQAVQKFPDGAKKFANAPYNIAEAEFNLSRYRESLDSYRSFLQKFPENEHGGYAMTRVAEILGILGIDSSRVQGAFLESFFRYRASPGAGVARIRLLTSRMSEMKDKELADALKEIDDITFRYANHPVDQLPKIRVKLGLEPNANAQNDARPSEAKAAESSAEGKPEQRKPASEAKAGAEKVASEFEDVRDAPPELPGIEDFTKLWTSDGFTARHDFDRATKDLIAYYQKFPQSPNKQKIRDRIVRNMSLAIAASVDHGEFIDALHRWSRDSVLWLKNTDRIGVRYDVGRAYEQAGVYKEAASIYSDNIKELAALQSSGKERERRVFDQMPNKDEVNLRLAAVASKQNEFNTAASYLRNIEGSSNLSDPEKIERAEISADVAEARGQADLASKYMTDLINTWKGRAELTSSLHLRIAKLQTKKRNLKDADSHLAKIIEMQKETSKVPEDVHAKALELRAELFVSRGQPQQAVQTITDLLELYETKRPLASMRYRLGQILFQDGDLKGAQNAWASLDGAKDGLWAHLAQEQMESEKWQREYKKYLTRIPAAQSLR